MKSPFYHSVLLLCVALIACGDDARPAAYDAANDTVLPVVQFLIPTANSTVEAGEIDLEVRVTDAGAILGVTFLLDDQELGTPTSRPWRTTWQTTDEDAGSHRVLAVATDEAGNEGSSTLEFTVTCVGGDCPPSISLVAEEWVRGEATLQAIATDDRALTSVVFLVDDVPLGSTLSESLFTWDTDTVSEGIHTVVARATDTSGQSSDAEAEVGVDRTEPEVEISVPQEGDVVADIIGIRANVTDISPTELRCGILGTSLANVWTGPYDGDIDSTELEPGEYNLICTATDAVGLTRQISRRIVIDRPPHLRITSPTAGQTLRARHRITVEAEDDVEVVRVEIYASDQLLGETDEENALWWSPDPDKDSEILRAIAYDNRDQPSEATVTVQIDVDPCDQDGDGVHGSADECEGTDCDDADPDSFPGAADQVGDGVDQNCDGVDGVDADSDGHASADSGGRDCNDGASEIYPCTWDPEGVCADRANDPRNCGACHNVCSVGLTCSVGQCNCSEEDCTPGTPEDYDLEGIAGTFFYRIVVVTDEERGEDVNDDGEPDNAFGPLVSLLAQLLGGNINRELSLQIENGILALGAAWPNLNEDLDDQEGVDVDIFILEDPDDDPRTQDAYLIARDSFLPGYQTPRSRFRDGSLVARRLTAGPAASFFLELSLGEVPLAITIDQAVLRGTLRTDGLGVALSSASIGGVLTLQTLVDTVNDFLLSEDCACVHLESPLVDLRAGQGSETCVGVPRPNRCAEEGLAVCATLARSCSLFMDLLFNEADIDTDDDGTADAFSVYLNLSGRGTRIEGLADE